MFELTVAAAGSIAAVMRRALTRNEGTGRLTDRLQHDAS